MSKLTIFDILTSVSNTKIDISDDLEFEKVYTPFMINRYLTMLNDTVYYAYELDKMNHLPKKLQYKWLLAALPQKRRFFKYQHGINTNEDVKCIMRYFNVNESKAADLAEILESEVIKDIKELLKDVN